MMEHLSNISLPRQLAIIDGPSTSAQAAAAAKAAAAAAPSSNAPPTNSIANGGNIIPINGSNSINGDYQHSGNSINMNGAPSNSIINNGGHNINGGTSMINGNNSSIIPNANSNNINGGNGGNGMLLNSANSYQMNVGHNNYNSIQASISSINYGLNNISINGRNDSNMHGGNSVMMNGGNSLPMNGGNSLPRNGGNFMKVKSSHNSNGGNSNNMNDGNRFKNNGYHNTYGGNNTMNMNGGNSYSNNGGNSYNNMNGAHNFTGGNGGKGIIVNGAKSVNINSSNGYFTKITSTRVFQSDSNTRHINFPNVGLLGELAELTACTNKPVPDVGLTITSADDATTASGSTNYSGTSSTASQSSDRCLPNNGGTYPANDPNANYQLVPLRSNISPPPNFPHDDFFMRNFLKAVERENQQNLTQQKQDQQEQQRKQQQQHHNQVLFNQPPPQHQQPEEEEGAVGGVVAVIAPIGTGPRNSARTSPDVFPNGQIIHANDNINRNHICEVHNELYRYVCDTCSKLVCQCCTLHEHKDHFYISISSFMLSSKEKLMNAISSSQTGTKAIKSSIDQALGFIRLVERNCNDLGETVRKSYRNVFATIEEREHYMLEYVDKLRQRRLTMLHDQMAGLKSALAGLAETSEMLNQTALHFHSFDDIDVALKLTSGERQMEQIASVYRDLQPKHENLAFINPDFYAISDVRIQGGICCVDNNNRPTHVLSSPSTVEVSVSTMSIGRTPLTLLTPNGKAIIEKRKDRQLMPYGQNNMMQTLPYNYPIKFEWDLPVMRFSPGFYMNIPRAAQCIPGSMYAVYVKHSNHGAMSFAGEGHEDGKVSRPWGICVDKFANIYISDRRNNRVQVFSMDGKFKFKFGRKGVCNGEFDLPAGICVDIDNRIIVVDKDNHRVQIFSCTGAYLNKFGSYGKEYGQFQYPWDVAVNNRRQIVVTDSRNHRIQQFDSEGRFIRQIVFENHGQVKGIASPRGVCYTPIGHIIVSDFDNHCLYLIDPEATEIISAKGEEGNRFTQFNRPSGLCCDDEGRIIVADSKNQRVLVFNSNLDFLWDIEIRPSINPKMPETIDEKDRTCDVAVMPDGRIVFLIELSPDSKEGSNPFKRFVHIC